MVEFSVFGFVVPRHVDFTLHYPRTIHWEGPDLTVAYNVKITASAVEVVCRTDAFSPQILNLALIALRIHLGGLLGLYSFGTGNPYSVILDRVQPPGAAEPLHIDIDNPRLSALCTAFDPNGSIVDLIDFVMADHHLMGIFIDLTMALNTAQYQPIACGRALDGVRNYLAPNAEPIVGWRVVQRALNASSGYLQYVTKRASKPRHRERHSFEDGEIAECMNRAWTVTNRLLLYCLRGKTTLAAPEFPLL